jgi:putative protein-disulfide isomerase
MTATLYYVHDPMCSWCWGFRPTWNALKQALPDTVTVENVSGGLARDCDDLMPGDMQELIEGYWRKVHAQLGTEFNFDFWRLNQPRRSTYMSCRAAIAAASQNAEQAMIDAIQRGYFLRALNPSDVPVLVKLAGELGLDQDRFERDLLSASTELEFQRQLKLARKLPIHGFPSLVLAVGENNLR